MEKSYVGDGKVVLIAGGGKIYADIAARFCHSNKELDDIIASPYNKNIVKNILNAGHFAALEFDNFIFGIEGYSRVTEVQLVRKRLASYMISSGRDERNGKREYKVVLPKDEGMLKDAYGQVRLNPSDITITKYDGNSVLLSELIDADDVSVRLNCDKTLELLESFYDSCLENGVKEEDARYMKVQGTAFKAIISMNSHALLDWFKIRCCENAQDEIQDLAWKMLMLCKKAAPDIFIKAGPNCIATGFCTENARQNPKCKEAGVVTQEEAVKIVRELKKVRGKIENN